MNPASHPSGARNTARPPRLRATSEAHGRRAATVNADTLSVEDASSFELARVMAGRGGQFSSDGGGSGRDDAGAAPGAKTRLQQYLDRKGIPAARVEREGPFSRETLRRWRLGEGDIRRKHMVRVLGTLQRITREPVRMEDIFDLDPDNPANWID